MNWRWIQGSEIHRHSRQWEDLILRIDPPDPFLTPAWLVPMAQEGLDFLVGYSESGQRMKAIVPVRRLYPRVKGLGGFVTPNSFGFSLKEEDVSDCELMANLLEISRHRGWMLIRLEAIASSDMKGVRECAAGSHWRMHTRDGKENLYLTVKGTFDDYERSFNYATRRSLMRQFKRLHALGKLELKVVSARDDWPSLIPVLEQIEALSWKWKTGIFSKKRRIITLGQLERMALKEALLIFLFVLNDRPMAFEIDFLWNHRLFRHNCAYDPQYAQSSPGACLSKEIVRFAFETGICCVEHLGRMSLSKKKWADGSRKKTIIDLYSPSLCGKALERFMDVYSTRIKPRSGGHFA